MMLARLYRGGALTAAVWCLLEASTVFGSLLYKMVRSIMSLGAGAKDTGSDLYDLTRCVASVSSFVMSFSDM